MSQEQMKDMSQYFYRASAADFMKIPGSPVAYWLSDTMRDVFTQCKTIGETIDASVGLFTCDNNRFLRFWYEISLYKIGFDIENREVARESKKKWFPYNKGGDYRKWFGNQEYVVNFENDGESVRNHRKESGQSWSLPGESSYFKPLVSWSDITSSTNSFRIFEKGFIYDVKGQSASFKCYRDATSALSACNNKIIQKLMPVINPTISFQVGNFKQLPDLSDSGPKSVNTHRIIDIAKSDWNSYEQSWNFFCSTMIIESVQKKTLNSTYLFVREKWQEKYIEMQKLEKENNSLFIAAYGLQDELAPDVPLQEITLTCNPHYRYGGNRGEEELETLLQCDTLRELVSYAIGCMMGRYSLDKPGLILASQGETLQDYLRQIPSPRFAPDDDAILPLTDQEWFTDDATNRFREFIRVVWGDEHLQENLDFVAESLCLHAIKPKRGESALDTIRRYLSTQFFKDHLRTYKKRPIYWLFSSGKHKAFECLVYLHRYNEGTLARMRTEYVIPLSAKLNSYAEKLEQDRDASTSAAETKRLEKELSTLHKQQAELAEFDEKLRHYADQRISLDLDDGVKVNYGKFGDLLAEVKAVTGDKVTAN